MKRKKGLIKEVIEEEDKTEPVAVVHVANGMMDDLLEGKFPDLAKLLAPIWRDGQCLRQAGTLKMILDGCGWVVQVHCPTEQVQALVSVESIVTALEELQTLLAHGKLKFSDDWKKKRTQRPVIA